MKSSSVKKKFEFLNPEKKHHNGCKKTKNCQSEQAIVNFACNLLDLHNHEQTTSLEKILSFSHLVEKKIKGAETKKKYQKLFFDCAVESLEAGNFSLHDVFHFFLEKDACENEIGNNSQIQKMVGSKFADSKFVCDEKDVEEIMNKSFIIFFNMIVLSSKRFFQFENIMFRSDKIGPCFKVVFARSLCRKEKFEERKFEEILFYEKRKMINEKNLYNLISMNFENSEDFCKNKFQEIENLMVQFALLANPSISNETKNLFLAKILENKFENKERKGDAEFIVACLMAYKSDEKNIPYVMFDFEKNADYFACVTYFPLKGFTQTFGKDCFMNETLISLNHDVVQNFSAEKVVELLWLLDHECKHVEQMINILKIECKEKFEDESKFLNRSVMYDPIMIVLGFGEFLNFENFEDLKITEKLSIMSKMIAKVEDEVDCGLKKTYESLFNRYLKKGKITKEFEDVLQKSVFVKKAFETMSDDEIEFLKKNCTHEKMYTNDSFEIEARSESKKLCNQRHLKIDSLKVKNIISTQKEKMLNVEKIFDELKDVKLENSLNVLMRKIIHFRKEKEL